MRSQDHAALQLPMERRGAGAAFDAGLVNPDGSPRPAYDMFQRLAAKLPR